LLKPAICPRATLYRLASMLRSGTATVLPAAGLLGGLDSHTFVSMYSGTFAKLP
jgi:hypothetical protein